MELSGKVVVITGGGSGIGRAMARRFAAESAAAVVVADRDAQGAAAVAAEIERAGGAALALACDVAQAAEIAMLVERAEGWAGPIDLFCANAGVAGGAGLDTPEELWDEAFAVNVRAHVVAARLLVPGWLERGGGYFLATASAAGLLGLVGAAPYPVTKSAAVAFAEWLDVTYRARGVRVSCLCPMAVRTPLLERGLATPGEAGIGLRVSNAAAELLEPDAVAAHVVAALAEERFLILPHPQVGDHLRAKAADHEQWMVGMRALGAHVGELAACLVS